MKRKDLIVMLMIIAAIMIMPAIEPSQCNCDAKVHYKTDINAHHEWKCIGTFKITAYNYSEGDGENYSTASGETPIPHYTVATDPTIIPLGTEFKIQGLGKVKSMDTGGAIHGYIIDYHIGYDSCESFGIKYLKVYVRR